MRLRSFHARLFCAALPCLFVFSACDGDDDKNRTSLVRSVDEPAGSNCVLGGIALQSGVDSDGSGSLSDGEITATQYICKPSANALILSAVEAAGTNCAFGGTKLETGVDDNANGTLEATEVDATQYVCAADPLTGEAFDDVYIETLDNAELYKGTIRVDGDLGIEIAGDDPIDITFPALRVIQGEFYVDCGGAGAVTVHLPQLEFVSYAQFDGDCLITIDMPKLQRLDGGIEIRAQLILNAPILAEVGSINVRYNQLITTLPTLPALKSLESFYSYAVPNLDLCGIYRLANQSLLAGGAVTNIYFDYQAGIACSDNSILCPIVTGDAANPIRACYQNEDWSDARTTCQSFGSGWDLAFFSSADDRTAALAIHAISNGQFWLGYSDDPALITGAVSGTFSWVQNVSGSTYAPQSGSEEAFWGGGQPDNSGGTEHCAQTYDGGVVNDIGCTNNGYRPLCRQL